MTAPGSVDELELQLQRQAAKNKSRRRAFLMALAVLPLLPFAWCGQRLIFPHAFDESFELTDEEKEDARAAIANARQLAETRAQAMKTAAQQAFAELGPTGEPGSCGYRLPVRPPANDAKNWQSPDWNYPLRSTTAEAFGELSFVSPLAWQSDGLEGRLDKTVYRQRDIDSLREDIARIGDGQSRGRSYQVVMVEALRKLGRPTSGTEPGMGSFDAGLVVGRAFLFERPSGKAACAADVVATNSDTLRFEYTTNGPLDLGGVSKHQAALGSLKRDLDVQVERAIARRMATIGPATIPFDQLARLAQAARDAAEQQDVEVPPMPSAATGPASSAEPPDVDP